MFWPPLSWYITSKVQRSSAFLACSFLGENRRFVSWSRTAKKVGKLGEDIGGGVEAQSTERQYTKTGKKNDRQQEQEETWQDKKKHKNEEDEQAQEVKIPLDSRSNYKVFIIIIIIILR